MTESPKGGGHRGYIASRPIHGTRVPQHIQNLVVREHARRHGLKFLLSATEYTMPDCYMMLEQVLSELPSLDGIICYSLFMLPQNPQRRHAMLAKVLAGGHTFHAAAEDIIIRTSSDVSVLDDILTIEILASNKDILDTLRERHPSGRD